MADSPNPSAPQSNIDDLVKELSRPQGSPPISSNESVSSPVSPTLKPLQSTPVSPVLPTLPPTPSVPQSRGSSIPQSSLGGTGGIGTPKTNPVPSAPMAPKEYQSSIRTMSDDLAKLKAGQQPQGVNIPRKIDNISPPTGGSKPAVPATPTPAPTKPGATSSMPSATKSAPMASTPNQSPTAPTSTPIPRPVMPSASMPSATKVPATKLDQKNQFYVPPADAKSTNPSSGSGSRSIIFVGIAIAVVLLGGGLYWYFMISSNDQVAESPIVTFTPRPTATPNPDVLSTIFTTKGGTIALPSSGDPVTAFSNGIGAQPNITPGAFTVIDIVSGASSSSAQALTVTGLLDRFVASYPANLKTALGQNYKFLLYGQKESFDSKGRPATNVVSGSRLIMVSEIASSSASASILQGWEPTMSTSLSGVMAIAPTKNTNAFTTTSYNGVSVRFKNFPYPDHSIDHALVQYNGKTYLVIAGSREAMFATIDAFSIRGK